MQELEHLLSCFEQGITERLHHFQEESRIRFRCNLKVGFELRGVLVTPPRFCDEGG